MTKTWDCIVVGGGAAGLSAALVLGRARRQTLLIDAGGQSNLPAHGIGGLLGSDGRAAPDFYAAGRAEIAAYPSVELRDGTVAGGAPLEGGGYELELADGRRERAKRVLLAGGMDYRAPELPGVAERWGRSVFHCPFCHGWEVRERPLAVLDRGPSALHRAQLLRAWSDEVTVLTNGPSELEEETVARLARAGVRVDERPVAELVGPGSELTAVRFADGSELACGGLLVPVTLHQRTRLAEQLGAVLADAGPLAADAVAVDQQFRSGESGIFAAGDTAGTMPSVANSVSSGASAAAMLVGSLMEEELAAA